MTRNKALSVGKPILFNTEMVKVIKANKKRVTRRVVKIQPKEKGKFERMDNGYFQFKVEPYGSIYDYEVKPPYQIGDILYIRETWCKYDEDHVIDGVRYTYKADATPVSEEARNELGYKWKPSIHMPKEAARIFLRVTDVRVERLQDMTEDDAFREGWRGAWCEHKVYENYPDSPIPCMAAANPNCPKDPPCDHSVPELFGTDIWNETIKKSDLELYGWKANPWVWVIEFERIEVTE